MSTDEEPTQEKLADILSEGLSSDNNNFVSD